MTVDVATEVVITVGEYDALCEVAAEAASPEHLNGLERIDVYTPGASMWTRHE